MVYGLGDSCGYVNKRDYDYVLWNTDDPKPHVDSYKSLYKSIPFFICFNKKRSYGIFQDNTFKSVFNFTSLNNEYYFGSTDGIINYYFIYGKDMKEIVSNYTLLTGRYPLPQKWTLGYQQSRWGYRNKKDVLELVDNFKKYDIGLDVVHLDIDYMENYKVFTISDKKFPMMKEFIEELNSRGIKIVTIIDPGVKAEKDYYVYEEGIKNNYFATLNGEVYHNTVWPGDSVFPNFVSNNVRNWWSGLTKFLVDNKVSGIWCDMNEPASFTGPLPDNVEFNGDNKNYKHSEIHNVYGHLMSKATYEGLEKNDQKRPFVITRACYSGTQKYSTVWTGDNHSMWPHLSLAITHMIGLSVSGIPFCGTDIGGFSGDAKKELMIRWIELGSMSPLFRNHSCEVTIRQEPWMFDEETINIYRKYVDLRYSLIPYFYDLFKVHENTGLPIIRPLVMEYPLDENTYNINDAFMVGDNILVSPVITKGMNKKMVYLPKGTFYRYQTNEKIVGPLYFIEDTPLDTMPIYIKDGSIIPHSINLKNVKHDDTLVLDIYGEKASYIHYQDNGVDFKYRDNEFNEYEISFEENILKIKLLNENYLKYDKLIIKKEGKEIYNGDFLLEVKIK